MSERSLCIDGASLQYSSQVPSIRNMKSYFTLMLAAAAVGLSSLTVGCSGGGRDGEEEITGYASSTKYDADAFFEGRAEVWLYLPTSGLTYVRLVADPSADGRTTTGTVQFKGPGMEVIYHVDFSRLSATGGLKQWPGLQINFGNGYEASPNPFPIKQYLHVEGAEVINEDVVFVQLGFSGGQSAIEMCQVANADNPPKFYYWSYLLSSFAEMDKNNFKPYAWAQSIFDGTYTIYSKEDFKP